MSSKYLIITNFFNCLLKTFGIIIAKTVFSIGDTVSLFPTLVIHIEFNFLMGSYSAKHVKRP